MCPLISFTSYHYYKRTLLIFINDPYDFQRITNGLHHAHFLKDKEGKMDLLFDYRIDGELIDLLGIHLQQRRLLDPNSKGDMEQSILVNEAFLKKFNIDDIDAAPLPEKFESFANAQIVGVVKDFHFESLGSAIKPAVLHLRNNYPFAHMLVKIKPDNVDKTLTQLRTAWHDLAPDKSFEFSFLSEDIQNQYLNESRWNRIIYSAALLAIIIAFPGLFALVTLALTARTKEIGVRKVLGAAVGLAGLIMVLFGLVTVSIQTARATMDKPVNALINKQLE